MENGFRQAQLGDRCILWANHDGINEFVLIAAILYLLLALDADTVLVIGFLTIVPAVGVGFVFAVLALLYKRLESFIQLMNIGFIGLIAAPVNNYPILKVLPLAQGSSLLRQIIEQNIEFWNLPLFKPLILIAVAFVYLSLGFYIFKWAQRRARQKGVLGHY